MSHKGLPRQSYAKSRMAKARVALGWTQRALAARAGVHHLHVSRMETDIETVSGEQGWTRAARSVAEVLGFTCEDLWPERAPKVPRLPRPDSPARPDDLYLAAETNAALRTAVAELPQRHATVIALRFGLRCGPIALPGAAVAAEAAADSEGMHLPDVGALIGVSASRAQQIETQAIAELAKMLKRAGLHV